MPNPRAFLEGFKLYNGLKFSNFVVEKVSIKHIVLEEYKRYSFPLVVKIKTNEKEALNLLEEFKNYTKDSRTVYSQYGNPYNCYIQDFSIEVDSVIKTLTGQVDRIFAIKCTGFGDR